MRLRILVRFVEMNLACLVAKRRGGPGGMRTQITQEERDVHLYINLCKSVESVSSVFQKAIFELRDENSYIISDDPTCAQEKIRFRKSLQGRPSLEESINISQWGWTNA